MCLHDIELVLAMFDWQAELATSVSPPVTMQVQISDIAMVVSSKSLARATMSPSAEAATSKPSFAQQRSFTHVLSPSITVTCAPLPRPTIQGDSLLIIIIEEVYDKGLERCKHHMHGRIFLNKGEKSYTSMEINSKLSKLWKTKGMWHMISLGCGFYEFSFTSDEDMHASFKLGIVSLKLRLLRLSQ